MVEMEISSIIDNLKNVPNCYERNKINSHLQDALVWAKELSRKHNVAPHPADQCTCVVGAVDKNCALHGGTK